MTVFDFHARLGGGPGAAEALLRIMDDRGIDRAAVSCGGLLEPVRLSRQIAEGGRAEVRADNDRLAAWCAGSGGRLVPFYFADPVRDVAAYRAAAGEFRGLEISPAVHGFRLDDPAVAELVAIGAAAGHPVYVACLARPGARTADLVRLARAVPEATFVWGHCGHTGLDLVGLGQIAGEPRILAETSGCLTATARRAVALLGPQRVLFGTEYPLQEPGVELLKARSLGLSDADLHAMFWGNACRVLNEETTWTPSPRREGCRASATGRTSPG
ncbi:amidohydrolase family protein [Actinoplanes sp. NPDC051513]|uniref:amidohydrolase family protein n=1 Tax=Actinoplanes sp. NPDC051513 TaxID=3363908 RepID=UPI0037940D8A